MYKFPCLYQFRTLSQLYTETFQLHPALHTVAPLYFVGGGDGTECPEWSPRRSPERSRTTLRTHLYFWDTRSSHPLLSEERVRRQEVPLDTKRVGRPSTDTVTP